MKFAPYFTDIVFNYKISLFCRDIFTLNKVSGLIVHKTDKNDII